ncbi:tetratricopeptide repeat-containing protein [Porphyromonas levii]|uniref:tetratricopeptide repeat-containing protein n=1 Tax=Porphyromonas levii TaxID=28114 RepID=UPI001B8B6FE1|nr:tetratricopeptide repeat-containing protein [Porphyromonas levii]MBR8713907.1 hypothetical protein [Porphyromonas levii]MBR8715927.1 hypothetical protein [Porphyromonas levii]MBR8728454.1 hypothetical protein [Porphyromonas levii]MBR8736781.1 hypothetical protein [Porphyromonas levii]MBR8774613.1 hypothetical protein [Porphyromonas levii]
MKKDKRICFVIMGFGKKQDPYTNKTIDLDATYNKIIRPSVEACSYKCIRADEILDSGVIDRSMYALLYMADLVIADITTDNANALYELGTRHALKPFSTIIINGGESKLPFDLNHTRILSYEHLGNEISEKEAKKSVRELKSLINAVTENPVTDSPLYAFIPKVKQPEISDEDLEDIIGDLRSKENTIYSLMEKAKKHMHNNQFEEAACKWHSLGELVENDAFYTQQEALCTYKSEKPSKISALTKALEILVPLKGQTDTETLGITGAINKRLWYETKDASYLDVAIEMYKKGWTLHQDYYTGENYALCLEQKSLLEQDERHKIHKQVEAEEIRKQIIDIILSTLEEEEPEELKWKYATLANCYFALGNIEKEQEYEQKFKNQNPDEWEIETYMANKSNLVNYKAK